MNSCLIQLSSTPVLSESNKSELPAPPWFREAQALIQLSSRLRLSLAGARYDACSVGPGTNGAAGRIHLTSRPEMNLMECTGLNHCILAGGDAA